MHRFLLDEPLSLFPKVTRIPDGRAFTWEVETLAPEKGLVRIESKNLGMELIAVKLPSEVVTGAENVDVPTT